MGTKSSNKTNNTKRSNAQRNRYRRNIVVIFLLVGLLLAAWGGQPIICGLGGMLIFSALVLDIILFRCPHCGKYLGMNFTRPERPCRGCGKNINEDAGRKK